MKKGYLFLAIWWIFIAITGILRQSAGMEPFTVVTQWCMVGLVIMEFFVLAFED